MANTKKQRVLIIEDEKNLARFVDLELQHEGYETEICYDGRSGLETALNKECTPLLSCRTTRQESLSILSKSSLRCAASTKVNDRR